MAMSGGRSPARTTISLVHTEISQHLLDGLLLHFVHVCTVHFETYMFPVSYTYVEFALMNGAYINKHIKHK